jgi:hypothetical protein
MFYNIITRFSASFTHVFHKNRKVRKYKNQLVHESDFLEIDGYFLKSMYILAPTIDTTSTTPHAISNIMPVSNKK